MNIGRCIWAVCLAHLGGPSLPIHTEDPYCARLIHNWPIRHQQPGLEVRVGQPDFDQPQRLLDRLPGACTLHIGRIPQAERAGPQVDRHALLLRPRLPPPLHHHDRFRSPNIAQVPLGQRNVPVTPSPIAGLERNQPLRVLDAAHDVRSN